MVQVRLANDSSTQLTSDVIVVDGVAGDGRAFDGDGTLFRLAAEALRIRMAGQFDPMLAVHTSELDPLPHQIKAVYGDLLARTPLRFLLADDPGAGKTIMAGLYIKELMLRGDMARCLIVRRVVWSSSGRTNWPRSSACISTSSPRPRRGEPERHGLRPPSATESARMDQLSRSEELQSLAGSEASGIWVVVDEAHRMSAHYFGGS